MRLYISAASLGERDAAFDTSKYDGQRLIDRLARISGDRRRVERYYLCVNYDVVKPTTNDTRFCV